MRRDFHRYPEVEFDENRTAGVIAEYLTDLGFDVQEGVAGTGIIAVLEGSEPGPTVMWRADMNGTAIAEKTKGDYTSRNAGISHACGHDGHMAIALGIATLLADRQDELPGTVKFVFQPGEEGGNGPGKMIEAGVLKDPDVDAIFGFHLSSDVHTGFVALVPGQSNAAATDFRVRLEGQGGHASLPHLCADPVVASAHLISALQSVVSREVDPTKDIVVSVGTIHGGTQVDTVPREVTLTGTVRAVDETLHKGVLRRVEKLAKGVADTFGLRSYFDQQKGMAPTSNDDTLTARVQSVIAHMLSADAIQPLGQLGAEDMAHYLSEVPGCYFMLGCRNDAKGCRAAGSLQRTRLPTACGKVSTRRKMADPISSRS